jgi:hypothetical protein
VLTEGVEFFQYIEVVPFQASGKIEEVLVVGRSAELQRPPEVITPPTATADEKGK